MNLFRRFLKPKRINFLVSVIAFLIFIISICSQYLFNHKPCQLCLITRYLTFIIFIVAFVASKKSKFTTLVFGLSFAMLVFCFYHLGVENHWWHGPQSCVSTLPTFENIEDINNSKVFCDKANWLIFGISSTVFSFLIAAFFFWISSFCFFLNKLLKIFEKK